MSRNDPTIKILRPSTLRPVNRRPPKGYPPITFTVIDYPFQPVGIPSVAAMLVPAGRESSWIFSEKEGFCQLVHDFPKFSRLILIYIHNTPESKTSTHYTLSKNLDSDNGLSRKSFLSTLILDLCPDAAIEKGFPIFTLLTYDKDIDVVSRVVEGEKVTGKIIGQMQVELIEVDCVNEGRDFRRRLTFKTLPSFIQTEVCVFSEERIDDTTNLQTLIREKKTKFLADTGVLIQSNLIATAAGLSKIATHLNERIQTGNRPRTLCLGVGGGALVNFLSDKLDFEVIGVELDAAVLYLGRQFFGLGQSKNKVRLILCDGVNILEEIAYHFANCDHPISCNYKEMLGNKLKKVRPITEKFDIIMVDLVYGGGMVTATAPPCEFDRPYVLEAALDDLCENGILIVNVLRTDYNNLVQELQMVFSEVYKLQVGNGANSL